jgi:hypothetical protein
VDGSWNNIQVDRLILDPIGEGSWDTVAFARVGRLASWEGGDSMGPKTLQGRFPERLQILFVRLG